LSDIRVTYSGLISFLVSFVGVITGTVFVIIVTRQLSPEDFGLWTLIGSLVSYVTIVNPVVTYWTTRQVARGEQVGKSALSTSGLFSLGGLAVYTGIIIFVSLNLEVDFFVLLISAALVPVFFIETILNSISLGYKPQVSSYGILAFESAKIPLGFTLVVLFPLGIIGVLIASIVASIVKIILLAVLTREKLIGTIKLNIIKFWLRLSWLTLYMGIFGFVRRLDVLLFSFMSGSVAGLAYWGVGIAASNLISYSSRISQGLYPKLIATGKKTYAEVNLQRIMYFALPILGASIIFAKPILHVLNPIYTDGVYIVIILSFRSFVAVLMGFAFSVIESFEKIDTDKQASFKQFVKSKLFLVATLNLIHSGIYIGALAIVFVLIISEMTDVVTVTLWSLIFFAVYIPFVIYGLVFIHKRYHIKFSVIHIGKYVFATITSVTLTYIIAENYLEYAESIFDFLPQFLPLVVLGGTLYFGITFLIDEDTRVFFRSIFKELKRVMK